MQWRSGRILVALLGWCCTVLAQGPGASISGTVTDPQGAVIAGVEVTATSLETGVKTTARTNEAGFYSIASLPIGSYEVRAELGGFRRRVESGLVLTTGRNLELNLKLELGAVAESVTVAATTSLLETRTSEASQLIESQYVEDLPLGDRRAMNLIEMTGAAVFIPYEEGDKPTFSLAGGRTQSQMYWIDGGSGQNMRLGIGQIDTDPPISVVQEVKVLANAFSAEYGASAGGVVIATTKSGTNKLRGSLSEYFRHQKLDAPHFFSPIVAGQKSKPSLRYNVYGGTIGGPIRRDRTFFFFSYEGSRRRDGSVRTLTVPTARERAGDFTQTYTLRGVLVPIYDPDTGRMGATRIVRDPFPGNVIPASRFDPVAVKLMDFYPLPNRPADDPAQSNNFRANEVAAVTRENFLLKLDHNQGARDKFSARYLYNSDDKTHKSVYPNKAADPTNDTAKRQQFWYVSWTRVLAANALNEFRFTYGNRIYHAHSKGLDGNWPTKLGMKGVPDDAFPRFAPANVAALGSSGQDRRQFPIQQYHLVNNLSWVRGRHSLKFGGEVRPSLNYEVNRSTVSGNFTFGAALTGQPGVSNTGNGIATMLLGSPTNFVSRQTPVLDRRSWYLGGFIQDDWNLQPGLTLNLGLRWETDTPMRDVNRRMNSFDARAINPVSGTPGVVRFVGLDGWPLQPFPSDWNNFGPRFGFAWRPLGMKKTVVRGGYGIFFAHPYDRGAPTVASLGYEISLSLQTQDDGTAVPYKLSQEIPIVRDKAPVLDATFGAVPLDRPTTTNVEYFDPGKRTGYSQQFNLQIQRELPGALVTEIGYLGNLSRKLPGADLNTNQIPPALLGPGAGRLQRPFPQFSNVTIASPSLGISSYHAGVLKVEKRFARGVNLLSTYTWSKFIENTTAGAGTLGDRGAVYSNFYNRRADYGPAENDIRHRFTLASSYQLPFGRGRRFLRTHPARVLLGGWSLSTVTAIQSAAPFTVHTTSNTTQAYSAGALRADVLYDPNLPRGVRTLTRWFDTEAFAQPPTYQFGNQGVNILRGDNIVKVNCSIIRSFNVAERKQLRFRGEFFNLLNHPDFGLPARTFEGRGFGTVTTAYPARRVQVGLTLSY